ncbi:hypothetical protein VHA01S_003_00480 [Vibrio halioticoli NBRC 102217]|uniref:VOC domain-containing protein n=1 Tax=Vibrio halioticoli NBRC 102217 TaxID=1219072 RepID=V5FFZ7_9VIBR|nr:VOC family protein [Vibrio halioticoli]GAD87972.1 hypothetical protein VHA01S_003_00480 [Vibrio halioticoli NBRC 102217]
MNPMFSALGVIHVDHYAVTTRDLVATLNDFLSIPGSKLLRGPGENPAQQVNYAFVELNGMGVVEILSPLGSESPILNHLQSGGGAYHLCYAVADLDNAIQVAEKDFGAKLVVEPRADGAFDGRRVVFLVHPVHGLFELLEAYPPSIHCATDVSKAQQNELKSNSDLFGIYRDIVDASASDFSAINMKDNPEWDSFKHLMFIMEIEKRFEISIPADVMGELNSLQKIDAYLVGK